MSITSKGKIKSKKLCITVQQIIHISGGPRDNYLGEILPASNAVHPSASENERYLHLYTCTLQNSTGDPRNDCILDFTVRLNAEHYL
jgi:hypothetical protein